MKRALCAAVLLCASCGRQESILPATSSPALPDFKGALALDEVRAFVAVGPRVAGTDGARRASDHIEARLKSLGVAIERQAFTAAAPGGSNHFVNLVATLPGSRPGVVILGAHYDTKSGIDPFEGANDSGSGVGVLLALAPLLKAAPQAFPTVRLAFLDGEECRVDYGPADGLHGSRHLAARVVEEGQSREVLGFILLDMIGDRDLTVTIPRNGTPELMTRVFAAATECGVRARFSLFRGSILDDHQPFLDAGIPAVDLIDFEYGTAPGLNDLWHTSSDTVDKLGAESLETVGRVMVRVLADLKR